MGMYDDVICNAPLPGDPPAFCREPGHRFQTKDLDCGMATYEIAEDGRLLRLTAGYGSRETIPAGGVAVDFHGDAYLCDGHDDEFIEYRARFTEGRLAGIVEVERRPSAPPINP